MSSLLNSQEAAAYWDARHLNDDELRSGGHRGLDYASNQIFYALRLGRLLEIIGDHTSTTEPLFVLDAGCGKGWFTRALSRFGHWVEGIDASPQAIKYAAEQGGTRGYHCTPLAAWSSPWLYDLVICVDVLFHVVSDEEWHASLINLASLVRLTGRLVVSDTHDQTRHVFGDYMVVRPVAEYCDVLQPMGFRYDRFVPYRFRDLNLGFHTLTRIG